MYNLKNNFHRKTLDNLFKKNLNYVPLLLGYYGKSVLHEKIFD